VNLSEGAPQNYRGTFSSSLLTAWHLLAGSAEVSTDDTRIHAETGDWVIRLPGTRTHTFSPDARIRCIHFFIRDSTHAAQWYGSKIARVSQCPSLSQLIDQINQTQLIVEMNNQGITNPTQISCELTAYLDYHALEIKLFQTLIEHLDSLGIIFGVPDIHDKRVRSTLRELLTLDDFQKPFSRTEFAAQHGLSASRLDQLWDAEMHTTPTQYWEERRLQKTQSLMQSTDTAIKEISFQMGFKHPSHFSIWFSKHTGESPSSFRKRHLNSE
tara:strand:+ start:561 stop:1370 length:810 start_codon:yes stop_codon:yes gene_type:complete